MSVTLSEHPSPPGDPGGCGPSSQAQAWDAAEAVTVDVMGAVNAGIARLVGALVDLLAADGWEGAGIRSPEHWVCWKANVSRARAEGLVRIARRATELPECWALFTTGRLGEDAMVRIARRVPTERDAEVAALAPRLLIAQLDRLLRTLPELPDPDALPRPEPERRVDVRTSRDGMVRGRFCLPADEGALLDAALTASRDAEFRDRNGLDTNAEAHPAAVDGEARLVTWADALVRMASAALDGLDPTLARTGHPGDRHQVVLHHDIDPDGSLGPGQLEHGAVVPDWMARYLACDAKVLAATYAAGKLIGIHPTERTPNRATRRALARRDQGCRHPLCTQRRWLHAHHIIHWEHNGATSPSNLVLLCPYHHRLVHRGMLSIDGDPEAGTLRFLDPWGQPIEPPEAGTPPEPSPGTGPPREGPRYTPPLAEPLQHHSFVWN